MEQNNKTQNKIVETYAEDMAKVIEDDKTGLIKKIIHEEGEHEKEKKDFSPTSVKNRIFILVGLLFILLGVITLFYFILGKKIPSVQIEQQFIPLIFTDKSTSIDMAELEKDKIIQSIYNKSNTTSVKKGGVEGIYLMENKQSVGLRKFITLIKSNFVPDIPIGSNPPFISDNFLMGVVNGETSPASPAGRDFFILLKVRSMSDVFDSLRSWEKKMFSDLSAFFGVDLNAETKYLVTKEWEDGIIQNKNTRVLRDKDPSSASGQAKKIVMMYIFADDNSVVITNTETAAREIMLRLAASRVKK